MVISEERKGRIKKNQRILAWKRELEHDSSPSIDVMKTNSAREFAVKKAVLFILIVILFLLVKLGFS